MAKNSLIVFFCLVLVSCSSAPKFSGSFGKIRMQLETPNDPLDLLFVETKTGAQVEYKDQSGSIDLDFPIGSYYLAQFRHSGQKAAVAGDQKLQFEITAGQTLDMGLAFDTCADWNDSASKTSRFKNLAIDQRQWTQAFQYGNCLLFWANPKQNIPAQAVAAAVQKLTCEDSNKIVSEFVQKDAAGYWLKTNPELNQYVVGEVGSFDTTVNIKSSKILSCALDQGLAKVVVEYEVKGSAGKRMQKSRETFNVVSTPVGPRIQSESLPIPHIQAK